MTTFVLIHGAGDGGWYWHLVAAELRERGHNVVAPDLPADDDTAGLAAYADAVVGRIGGDAEVVVIGQSFGGFTAPLVCDRINAELLVFVAGMIPSPGERPDEWWSATGYDREPRDRDRECDRGVHVGDVACSLVVCRLLSNVFPDLESGHHRVDAV